MANAPEMRRRPDEHDQKHEQCASFDLVGYRSPAENGRRSTRGSANHNILRCRTLEPGRVDDGVADQRA